MGAVWACGVAYVGEINGMEFLLSDWADCIFDESLHSPNCNGQFGDRGDLLCALLVDTKFLGR